MGTPYATNPYEALASATVMLDEIFKMEPIAQTARFGDTVQHITRTSQWAGGALTKKFENQIFSRTLSNSDLEADAPLAGRVRVMEVTVEESHLRKLHFSMRYTIPTRMEVDGSENAVYDIAIELAVQALQSLDEKRNHMIHQNSDGVKAVVVQKYDVDGTTWGEGNQTVTYFGTASVEAAFLTIDQGSISKFHVGELIDIRNVSTSAVRITGVITDVYYGLDYYGQSIGPGILVAHDATGEDSSFTNVVDNDEIFSSGEADGSGLPVGFSTLFQRWGGSALPYFSVTDRRAAGFQFLMPYGRDYATGGVSEDIDVGKHFGHMADLMGMLYGPARKNRRHRGFEMTEAIVCLCQPDLVNAVAANVGNVSHHFTTAAAETLTDARRKSLVGVAGWTGAVIFHPTLPPIVLQPEPIATKDTIRIIEPVSFEFIRMGSKKPTFIRNDNGGMWHTRRNTSDGQLTMHKDASGFVYETLFCDQPQLNYSIEGVKTDIDS